VPGDEIRIGTTRIVFGLREPKKSLGFYLKKGIGLNKLRGNRKSGGRKGLFPKYEKNSLLGVESNAQSAGISRPLDSHDIQTKI
jgi:hypothetical protein